VFDFNTLNPAVRPKKGDATKIGVFAVTTHYAGTPARHKPLFSERFYATR